MNMADAITVSQAARLTGKADITIRRALQERRLNGTKIGRMWFTTPEWIAEYLIGEHSYRVKERTT